ncbi:MAG: BtrH N-terminal domain-containing protein, partial [Spirochaetia bacterium]|nr:BtrH N-terminal domain-containing protein [Spirochaetia bacterium]
MPVVAHFQHVLGRHCGSTALSDMVRYAGWPLSEAACFGLGAGLESVFLEGSAEYPTGWFLGRGSDLEDVFFKTVNIPDPRRLGESFADVQSFLHRRLREAPVMVQGDVAALPYYNSPEHFTGHKFVVVGTETDGSFLTADTAFPGFQRVTPQALEQAMSFETELFPGKYIYFDIPCPLPPLAPATLSISVKAALRKQAENLLGTVTSQSGPFHHGPRAFSIWKKHLERLAEQTDATRT